MGPTSREKAAGAYAHAPRSRSGPPQGVTTTLRLSLKLQATLKGAAPQHSESETS